VTNVKYAHKFPVIITRSSAGNKDLAKKLRKAGYLPICINLLKFAPPKSWKQVDLHIKKMHLYNWLLFTSSTGVYYFAMRCKELGIDLSKKELPRIASVGPGTEKQLKKLGLRVDFIPDTFTTLSLGEELPVNNGKSVLIFRSSLSNASLSNKLRSRGFDVSEVHIYDIIKNNVRLGKRILTGKAILFGSPSAVSAVCSLANSDILDELRKKPALCIGPVTAAAAKEAGFEKVLFPTEQTFQALVRLVEVVK
jgi:uroporphyrinogen III methyltransferase/synthase